ncbi:MAG TPA: hypothetical protein VGC42_24015 [Kofleriaceae bacterium]
MGYLASPARAALVTSALLALATLAAGCGKEIGDSCTFDTDCDANGNRTCVDPTAGHGGYCSVLGCDYQSCPDEATCVRFFTGGFSNKACTDDTGCTEDELCAIEGQCVPRSSEVRYCMKKCDDNGDCRDGYECRTFDLARQHGGEAVLAPGTPVDKDTSPKFCAVAPTG